MRWFYNIFRDEHDNVNLDDVLSKCCDISKDEKSIAGYKSDCLSIPLVKIGTNEIYRRLIIKDGEPFSIRSHPSNAQIMYLREKQNQKTNSKRYLAVLKDKKQK